MDIQQTNRKLSDLEYKMRTLTKDENPNFETFNEDIKYIETYLKAKNIPKPSKKQVGAVTELVYLFTEYIGNYMNLEYMKETREIGSTGNLERTITSGTQKPTLNVLEGILGKQLSALNNSAELENQFYQIKEDKIGNDIMSGLNILNATGGVLSAVGIASLINFMYKYATGNEIDSLTNNILSIAPISLTGYGLYLSQKAKKVKENIKEIFGDLKNKILPSISKEEIKDESSSIEAIDKKYYNGLFLTTIGVLGTTIYGKELYDSVASQNDNLIKSAVPFIGSIPISVYGSYILYNANKITEKIRKLFNIATRTHIPEAYNIRLKELETEGILLRKK